MTYKLKIIKYIILSLYKKLNLAWENGIAIVLTAGFTGLKHENNEDKQNGITQSNKHNENLSDKFHNG